MRVAIIHDYLTQFGGAERVLKILMELFPAAPVYTLVHDPRVTEGVLDARRIRTSFLQRVPLARSRHRLFPLFMPLAVEQFDLSAYDLVLSASHSFGKGVITKPETLHVSYCFTPLRYAWDDSHRYVREFGVPAVLRALVPAALTYVRVWDVHAADRVDQFLAISEFVAQRIAKYYGRTSTVIPPPVDTTRFLPGGPVSDRFLVVSRLLPYKRIDLAIEACNRLRLPLDIVGTGPEEERLRALAGPTIRFHGFLPDAVVARMYASCRAFLFPQEEDFGITVLEAAAAGRPVVAFRGGGALETVVENVSGVFVDAQTGESLAAGIETMLRQPWDPAAIRRHALRFDVSEFRRQFISTVRSLWRAFPRKRAGVVDHLQWLADVPDTRRERPSAVSHPLAERAVAEHSVLS
ncbi:MAG: group 1 glycosyl transferase [Parcubacteria group bacterium Gr01-1014_106]|nr:MAG: group 1 glycosyl transferase [Parcubacteria group bacterium Gr01-1014_106]